MAYSGDEIDGQFLPIQEMNRSDADTTLMFLAGNNVRNTNPVDDPIFSAHRVGDVPYHGNVYYSDYVTSVVGCIEQVSGRVPTWQRMDHEPPLTLPTFSTSSATRQARDAPTSRAWTAPTPPARPGST